jgi:hypothetical protein
VICYTGEADGKYAGEITKWDRVGDYFTSLARWVAGPSGPLGEGMLLTQEVKDGVNVVQLHLDPERKGESFTSLPGAVTLRSLQGEAPRTARANLRWTGADTLAIEVPLGGTETTLTTVEVPGYGPVALPPVCVPYSPEFKPDHNERGVQTLEKLSRSTGGKERLELATIWQDMPRQPRMMPMTRWLLAVVMALLLLEVLERRTGLLCNPRWLAAIMAGRDAEQTSRKPSILAGVVGVLGVIVGIGVGQYAGLTLLFPLVLACAAGWLLFRLGRQEVGPMIPAAGVLVGHGLWMLVGLILLQVFDYNLIDVALLVGGGIWLTLRPSILAVTVLTLYELVGLVMNGLLFALATPGADIHKALLVHILLRVLGVGLMLFGIVQMRKQSEAPGETGAALETDKNEGKEVKRIRLPRKARAAVAKPLPPTGTVAKPVEEEPAEEKPAEEKPVVSEQAGVVEAMRKARQRIRGRTE